MYNNDSRWKVAATLNYADVRQVGNLAYELLEALKKCQGGKAKGAKATKFIAAVKQAIPAVTAVYKLAEPTEEEVLDEENED